MLAIISDGATAIPPDARMACLSGNMHDDLVGPLSAATHQGRHHAAIRRNSQSSDAPLMFINAATGQISRGNGEVYVLKVV
jgi:hypothetical protein